MKTSTKLMLIAMLAFAAGGTCPSDVNNDGTVGINDFLQLLGDWGPCPNATVVDADFQGSGWSFRIWSDNTLEAAWEGGALDCFECKESPPVGQWLTVESPPSPPGAFPIALAAGAVLNVSYSEGTTLRREFNVESVLGCDGNPKVHHCEFHWETPWVEFPEVSP